MRVLWLKGEIANDGPAMPKKPLVVDANTILATKGTPLQAAAHAPPQRGERASDRLVDLNFKVPVEFRRRFKQLALDADLKNVQLLRRAVDAYERDLLGR